MERNGHANEFLLTTQEGPGSLAVVMSRPDPSITFLRSFGFSVVRLPKAGRRPLQVMHRKGKDLNPLGDLLELFVPGNVPPPPILSDAQPGVSIEGKETGKVNVNIGLTILGGIIKAFGGSDLGLSLAYKKARTVTFEYRDVFEDSVSRLGLEQFVNRAGIRPENSRGTVDKLLDDEVYVLTSTLKSRKFVVEAQAEGGMSIQADVPVIKDAVGGNLKVETEGQLQTKVLYEGPIQLVFGIQAVQLVFDETGQFLTTEQLTPGDAAARGLMARSLPEAPDKSVVFFSPLGAFARIND